MEKSKEMVSKKTAPRPVWDLDGWFNESLLRPFAPLGFPRLSLS